MSTETKQFIIFPKPKPANKSTFFKRAQKHIFKKKDIDKNLSNNIDKIVYEI